MPTTYVPITDPEQAEQLYEAGLLWEHNIRTMHGYPPVPAQGWQRGSFIYLWSSGRYPNDTNWRLYIQLED